MEESVLVKGWVYKQSRFLKRLYKEWMIVSGEALTTYKKSDEKSHTSQVSVKDIRSVDKSYQKGVVNGFCVCTEKQDLQFFSDSASTERWVRGIHKALQSSESAQKLPLNTTEDKIRSEFQRIRAILDAREQELQEANLRLYKSTIQTAQRQQESLAQSLESVQGSFQQFTAADTSSYNLSQFNPHKLVPTENPDTSELALSLDTNLLVKMVQDNMKLTCINPFEMEVSRSQITRALKWRYSGDKIDALSFTVSTDVTLTAIGMCRPYRPDGHLTVQKFQLLNGPSVDSRPIYVHKGNPKYTFCPETSVFKLHLSNPILLKRDTVYTVYFLLEGTPSYKCVDCDHVCVTGNVTWKFRNTEFPSINQSNRTDSVCGPVARFYFIIN